jgi:hypothetical protein
MISALMWCRVSRLREAVSSSSLATQRNRNEAGSSGGRDPAV